MNSLKSYHWILGLIVFFLLSCEKQSGNYHIEKFQHWHYLDQFERECNVKVMTHKVHTIMQWGRMKSRDKWLTIPNCGFIFNRKQQLIFSYDENEKSVYYYTKSLKPLRSITFNKSGEMLFKEQFLYATNNQLIALWTQGRLESKMNRLLLFSYGKNQLKLTNFGEHVYQIAQYAHDHKVEIIYTMNDKGDTLNHFKDFYTKNNELIRAIKYRNSSNCAARNVWAYTYDRFGNCTTEKTHNLLITHHFQYDRFGNWIEKTSFYDKETIPFEITYRKITYFN